MPTQVQWRRGTTLEHSSFTGAVGEVTIDTDKKVMIVHDGSTLGGIPTITQDIANSIFRQANSAYISQNTTGVYANTAYLHANSAYVSQNTTGVYANSAYTSQNTTGVYANTAYLHANSAYLSQNTTGSYANSAYLQANSAYVSQNTTGVYANGAYALGNVNSIAITSTGNYANAAYALANASASFANTTFFTKSGGTITGDVTISTNLSVTGNLVVGGNTTTLSANNLVINDTIIYLANNAIGNTGDIGMVGHFTQGTYQHTGVVRDATDGKWKFFSNVATEPSGTTVTFDGTEYYDTVKMGIVEAVSTANIGGVTYVGTNYTTPMNGANPIVGMLGHANNYIQAYVYNANTGIYASSDFALYPANGNDTSGWLDFGITSNNYNQAAYSITGANEGYLFMSSPIGASKSGNLVIATDSTGVYNSIEFYLGGFGQSKGSSANVKFTTQASATSISTGAAIIKGGLGVTNNLYADAIYDNGTRTLFVATAASSYANSAYTQANTATTNAATADQRAVTSGDYANSAFTKANTATTNAATADQRAVTSGSYANSAYAQANTATTNAATATTNAATADQKAVSAGSYANSAFIQANTAVLNAASASSYANSAFAAANSASSSAASKVASVTASTGVTIGGTATAPTVAIGQAVGTGDNVQHNSLGVGTAASATAGEIRATNNITAYYSDDRLKTRLGLIENALSKLMTLEGFYYEANQTAVDLGYEVKREVGVSAQQVQAIMPEVVAPAPIDENYLTVRYEKLIPLLIQSIKEQQAQIEELQKLIKQ